MSETSQDDFGPVSEIKIGVTDEEIIEMIKDRKLLLGINSIVLKRHEAYLRYVQLKPIFHWKSKRKQFIIGRDNRQRKIGANRLLWLLIRHEPIPEDMDIDHEDGDRTNDDPSNLRLRDSCENHCDNISKNQMEDALAFFDQFIPQEQ